MFDRLGVFPSLPTPKVSLLCQAESAPCQLQMQLLSGPYLASDAGSCRCQATEKHNHNCNHRDVCPGSHCSTYGHTKAGAAERIRISAQLVKSSCHINNVSVHAQTAFKKQALYQQQQATQ
jgi:hypothetical protein